MIPPVARLLQVSQDLEGREQDLRLFQPAARRKNGLEGISRLPFSLKVLLENLLRHEDGRSVTKPTSKGFAQWLDNRGKAEMEIAFRPARVLMQDFTGVPAVVDLAAMRDAMQALGGDPKKINPLAPVDLVIDHSVMVDFFGTSKSFKQNVALEYDRNGERYTFLKWGQRAFDNFRVVPPGTGICHQVNLEYLARTVWTKKARRRRQGARDRVSRHAGRHRQPHHHGQRPGRAGLGRRRHRSGSGDARPAHLDAHSGSDRLQAHRQARRRNDRHRPRAHRHPDAAQEGRGRQVRRILRPGSCPSLARGHGDHRQHGARIWRDLRLLPDLRRNPRLPEGHRPRAQVSPPSSRHTARRRACSGRPRPPIRYSPTRRARPRHRRAFARRPEASAGPGDAQAPPHPASPR